MISPFDDPALYRQICREQGEAEGGCRYCYDELRPIQDTCWSCGNELRPRWSELATAARQLYRPPEAGQERPLHRQEGYRDAHSLSVLTGFLLGLLDPDHQAEIQRMIDALPKYKKRVTQLREKLEEAGEL